MKTANSKKRAKDIPESNPVALIKKAKELEINGELEVAASLYEKVIKTDPHQETAYNRLMIILRKQKEYKKELFFFLK